MYDTVGIWWRERAFKGYIETYNVEVVDKISLSDSLFLAKSSIVDLFKDLLKEKRSFKYVYQQQSLLKFGIMQLINMILKQSILFLKQ